jgi:hypothetical protein
LALAAKKVAPATEPVRAVVCGRPALATPRAVLVRRRRLVIVSEQDEPGLWGAPSLTLDELARRQHAKPVADLAELAADIWESDEELDAFLVDFRESRDSSLG